MFTHWDLRARRQHVLVVKTSGVIMISSIPNQSLNSYLEGTEPSVQQKYQYVVVMPNGYSMTLKSAEKFSEMGEMIIEILTGREHHEGSPPAQP